MSAIPLHDAELVDSPAIIPPGTYQAVYLHHETAMVFNSAKCFVHFRIADTEYQGLRLYRAYRVHKLRGKPRRHGAFSIRHSHDLYREFVRLSGRKERPDRISLKRLKGCLLEIKVRTVTKDAGQKELPEALRYSVVDSIIGICAGEVSGAD